jgi:hypothetical protein
VAQDKALREKRRALGHAIAAGFAEDDATIDDELIFIRAVADLDMPHIQLLAFMAQTTPGFGKDSGSPFHTGWSTAALSERMPGLAGALSALLSTLQSYSLVRTEQGSGPYSVPDRRTTSLRQAGTCWAGSATTTVSRKVGRRVAESRRSHDASALVSCRQPDPAMHRQAMRPPTGRRRAQRKVYRLAP